MNIVTYCYGEDNDRNMCLVSSWLQHYQNSGTKIPAILLFDENLDKRILHMWPYEALQLPQYITVELTSKNDEFVKNLKSCIIKMLAFPMVGKCIVMDCDTLIKKQIRYEMIPYCKWGIVRNTTIPDFTVFDEFDHVEACYPAVQIFMDDFYELFQKLFVKYIYRVHRLPDINVYGSAVTSLAHKMMNGTFIHPEWGWDCESPYTNKNIILKQYHMNHYMFMNNQYHVPNIGLVAK